MPRIEDGESLTLGEQWKRLSMNWVTPPDRIEQVQPLSVWVIRGCQVGVAAGFVAGLFLRSLDWTYGEDLFLVIGPLGGGSFGVIAGSITKAATRSFTRVQRFGFAGLLGTVVGLLSLGGVDPVAGAYFGLITVLLTALLVEAADHEFWVRTRRNVLCLLFAAHLIGLGGFAICARAIAASHRQAREEFISEIWLPPEAQVVQADRNGGQGVVRFLMPSSRPPEEQLRRIAAGMSEINDWRRDTPNRLVDTHTSLEYRGTAGGRQSYLLYWDLGWRR